MSRDVIDVFLATRGLEVKQSAWHTFKIDSKNEVEVEVVACRTAKKKRVLAFVCLPSFKISFSHLKEIISVMDAQGSKQAIVFYDEITPVAKQNCKALFSQYHIEIIHKDYVTINPLEHELVPRHELAFSKGTSERTAFLDKYGKNLPWIKSTDVICLYHGFKKGDVILIHRRDLPVYRIVV